MSQPAVLHRGAGNGPPGQTKECRPRPLGEVGFSFGAGGLPGFGNAAIGVDGLRAVCFAIQVPKISISKPYLISISWYFGAEPAGTLLVRVPAPSIGRLPTFWS